jgi:hypothetical protein
MRERRVSSNDGDSERMNHATDLTPLPPSDLQRAFILRLLRFPEDRRYRKHVRHHLRLEDGAEFLVEMWSTKRMPILEDGLHFLRWLLTCADRQGFVSLGRLREFELSVGQRDLEMLQDRLERCAVGIYIRYRGNGRLAITTLAPILAFYITDMCHLRDIWFEPATGEKGVWVDREILDLLVRAQEMPGLGADTSTHRTETLARSCR